MYLKAIKGTSHDTFASMATSSSSSFKVMADNKHVLKLNIGGKVFDIDREITVYFGDDRQLILGEKKVNTRGITFLNNPPHSSLRDTYGTNQVAKLLENSWIDDDI